MTTASIAPRTRDDLLTYLAQHGACLAFRGRATFCGPDVAAWLLECDNEEWLIWLLSRVAPAEIAVFAWRCALRIKMFGGQEVDAGPDYALRAAYAAAYASFCSHRAARIVVYPERTRQLDDLRAIVRRVWLRY